MYKRLKTTDPDSEMHTILEQSERLQLNVAKKYRRWWAMLRSTSYGAIVLFVGPLLTYMIILFIYWNDVVEMKWIIWVKSME